MKQENNGLAVEFVSLLAASGLSKATSPGSVSGTRQATESGCSGFSGSFRGSLVGGAVEVLERLSVGFVASRFPVGRP